MLSFTMNGQEAWFPHNAAHKWQGVKPLMNTFIDGTHSNLFLLQSTTMNVHIVQYVTNNP